MENQKEMDEITAKMYEELHQWESEVWAHNDRIIDTICKGSKDFARLMEYCRVTDKIELTDTPVGQCQDDEAIGVFTEIWVDQWSVGDSGDSYAGFVYAKYDNNKWLKIPYDC